MTRLGQMLVDKGMQEGMREGMKEGREEEKLSNARNLIDLLDAETIAERIGLPLEIVQKIKRESKQGTIQQYSNISETTPQDTENLVLRRKHFCE